MHECYLFSESCYCIADGICIIIREVAYWSSNFWFFTEYCECTLPIGLGTKLLQLFSIESELLKSHSMK